MDEKITDDNGREWEVHTWTRDKNGQGTIHERFTCQTCGYEIEDKGRAAFLAEHVCQKKAV